MKFICQYTNKEILEEISSSINYLKNQGYCYWTQLRLERLEIEREYRNNKNN